MRRKWITSVFPARRGFFGAYGRVEQQCELIQRIYVKFAFPADIAFPGREIRDGDHAAAREGEIGDLGEAHHADTAGAAWNGFG